MSNSLTRKESSWPENKCLGDPDRAPAAGAEGCRHMEGIMMKRGGSPINIRNRNWFRVIAATVFIALMTAGSAGSALGNEAFAKLKSNLDITKKGSVTLTLTDPNTKKGMSGISLEITRVASVVQNDKGNYEYVYTDSFKNCRTDLSKLSEADMGAREAAAVVQAYAVENNITGITMKTDAAGKVSYTGLDLGVYLVRNNPVPKDGTTIRSFLVTVPRLLNNEYVYDVDATAKPEVSVNTLDGDKPKDEPEKPIDGEKKPQPSTEGTKKPQPSTGGGGNTPQTLTGSKLPQTGQLWWPVPVLSAAGLILIILGIVRRRKDA